MDASAFGNRRIELLLTAILVLLLLMTGGAVGAGLFAWHQYSELQKVVGQPGDELKEAAETSRKLAEELAHRQALISSYLEQRSAEATKELASQHKRRDDLGAIPKGPIQKFDMALQFIQLLSDQVLLLQRQITEIEAAAAKAIRPLPGATKAQKQSDADDPAPSAPKAAPAVPPAQQTGKPPKP